MQFMSFLLTAGGAPAGEGGGTMAMLVSILPMVAIFVIMYFIMIRPQRKKEKQTQDMQIYTFLENQATQQDKAK